MPCQINNNSNFDITEIEDLLQDLFSFSQNHLGFKKPPILNLMSDESNTSPLGKTAHYDPNSMEIVIYVDGRHPKDIMRSFSHELVHHNQNENGMFDREFTSTADGYAQSDPHLRKMEKEAYLKGNMCFRDWEDGYKSSNPNILNERRIYKMSIKKWKNKELNTLLNEKWGFSMDLGKLNEEKKKMVKDPKTGKMVPDYAIDGKGKKDLKEEELEEISMGHGTSGDRGMTKDERKAQLKKDIETGRKIKTPDEKKKNTTIMKEEEEDKTAEVASALTQIDDIRKGIQKALIKDFPGTVLDNEATQRIIDVVLDAAARAPTSLKTQAKDALDHYQVNKLPLDQNNDSDDGGGQGGTSPFHERKKRIKKK